MDRLRILGFHRDARLQADLGAHMTAQLIRLLPDTCPEPTRVASMALEWCNPKSDLWRLNVRCSSCFIKDDELVVDFIIDHVMPNGEQKRWKGSLDETLDRVCALLRVDKPVKTWHVRATIPRSAGETTESECIGTEEDAKLELWHCLEALGVETAAVPEEDIDCDGG